MPAWYRWRNDTLVLQIAVIPGAKRDEIAGLHGPAVKVRLRAPPVDGKANAQLIAFLADLLHTPRSRISLLSGLTSRTKIVAIDAPVSIPSSFAEFGLRRE
ncbi:MAG TPA: DUF167 family protein [Steroidobacteraceae bacterium]|nr:DUF167 family protein [Steroidobacteraceae bacterium]